MYRKGAKVEGIQQVKQTLEMHRSVRIHVWVD